MLSQDKITFIFTSRRSKVIKHFLLASLLLAGCNSEKHNISAPELPDNSTAGAPISLYTFDCGSLVVSDLGEVYATDEYSGKTGTMTNPCFLIRHPKGDLLWDLGMPHDLAGNDPVTFGNWTVALKRTLIEQLADIGLSEKDIEFIAISHSHGDHSGQAALFPDSQWLVNKNEFDFMFSTEAAKTKNAPFAGLNNSIHTGDLDVFGDGSVIILALPGHTPGHSALQVNLPESGPILLTGDLYYFTKSRELQLLTLNIDEAQTRESMETFEALARKLGARVIIQHEPRDVATLPKPPAFLQ
jgi:glyoxylase-like metal-dependent hydrolase (beta-lactamase superfamily II)